MGNLLKLLSREDGGAKYDIFLDFESKGFPFCRYKICDKITKRYFNKEHFSEKHKYQTIKEKQSITKQNTQNINKCMTMK